MGYKVKLNANTSSNVHVPGLGSIVPGEWIDITDEQAERFKKLQGMHITKAAQFEVKKTAAKKKEDE